VEDAWDDVKEGGMQRFVWTLLAAAVLAGCGGGDDEAGELTVYAAASLTDVLPAVEPDARYSFAGSDELATQIREGAPADVYAAASTRYPDELSGAGLVDEPLVFATNRLVLIVPSDNPARIQEVNDVARPGTKLVVAAEGVPVGDYARTVLGNLKLEDALANVVSNEDDVKGVVAKVSIGEADAGFVYATDAAVADGVRVVELPDGAQPPIEYAVAVVASTSREDAARAFVQKLRGPEGREALRAAGFGVP
jgi:molybdate transport system substrate-binding protein